MTRSSENFSSNPVLWNLQQAELLTRQRKWAEADQCFAAAVAEDDSPTSCVAYGCTLAEQERYHDAIVQMTAALDRASSSGNREAVAAIYHNFASIYRDLGDFGLARRFQRLAISQSDDCGPEELLGLANDAWISGETELAECLAASSAELVDPTDRIAALEADATLGAIAGMSGEPQEAIQSLWQVYRVHQANDDYRAMGIDLMNLSALFGELGRHRREMACVRRALRCFELAPAPVSAEKARRVLTTLERLQSVREFDPSRN